MADLVEQAESSGPVVVLLHSWWGLTDHFRTLARRFADSGFTTVAADLYRGAHTDDPVRARELRLALSDEDARTRALGAVDQASELADGRPVGVVGFSFGAELGIKIAAELRDRISAAVAFYGVCVPPNLAEITAPIQAHVATEDEFATAEEVGEFTQHLVALGKSVELYSYPGAKHAFFNTSRPEAYDADAAETAWRRTVDFLGRTLS
ncbi:dienelactone hydrolase family protein [Actinocrispum wychmicini]|uniref:Carboxymethylenebutenolidase n=1 Tax=Actinocrispum wychmicini TaxID=1213861 RepID=A0A4R2J8J8_9PSEU|nr:alpha/beta fold hydrolase [Actinocrispum wychmicini]TCO55601.1 carboxymethylenebutenolidase [Actinocrispum wychmicini]